MTEHSAGEDSSLIKLVAQTPYATTLVDPFHVNCFYDMNVHVYNDRDMLRYGWKRCSATINFKNGATTGSHSIDGDSLIDIHNKLLVFIENELLPKEEAKK